MTEPNVQQDDELIDYEAVAKLMGEKYTTVRAKASRDESFPKPAGSRGRSVLFSRADVVAYIDARSSANGEMLDYEGIAKLMNVTVPTVRTYAFRDELFPKPTPSSSGRSRVFARADVESYIKQRVAASSGRVGRPPRSASKRRGDSAGGAFGARVRASIATHRHGIQTQRELAERLGISVFSLGQKLNGNTSWKRSELQLIEAELGVVPSSGVLVREDPETRRSTPKEQS